MYYCHATSICVSICTGLKFDMSWCTQMTHMAQAVDCTVNPQAGPLRDVTHKFAMGCSEVWSLGSTASQNLVKWDKAWVELKQDHLMGSDSWHTSSLTWALLPTYVTTRRGDADHNRCDWSACSHRGSHTDHVIGPWAFILVHWKNVILEARKTNTVPSVPANSWWCICRQRRYTRAQVQSKYSHLALLNWKAWIKLKGPQHLEPVKTVSLTEFTIATVHPC